MQKYILSFKYKSEASKRFNSTNYWKELFDQIINYKTQILFKTFFQCSFHGLGTRIYEWKPL